MKDDEESLDNPAIAAEYEQYLDSKIENLAQDFESWLEEVSERVDDLEQQAQSQGTSQKQRPF